MDTIVHTVKCKKKKPHECNIRKKLNVTKSLKGKFSLGTENFVIWHDKSDFELCNFRIIYSLIIMINKVKN